MNPEFRRNLWLEVAPRRLLLWGGMLGLVFFAAALTDGSVSSPASVARWLYYAIVVFWGGRDAALSVVGEIRDRTWDAQRLSSLGAGEMTWGKLFGATAFQWYGGGLCLLLILAGDVVSGGPVAALVDFVYFVEIGLIAQASALLASLVAVRRRQMHSRTEVFIYQLAGLAAALAVFVVWESADPAGALLHTGKAPEFVQWWGLAIAARTFLLVSLAAFTGWILAGCWREMRLELKLRNGPLVWLGFLIFVAVYVAGFGSWLDTALQAAPQLAHWDAVAVHLLLAALTCAALTYATVLLEPKDRVHLRWLGSQIGSGRIGAFLSGLQPFMMSYLATLGLAAALLAWQAHHHAAVAGDIALLAAAMGFVTRDVGLFLLVHAARGRTRSDVTAVLLLIALYLLIPAILGGVGLSQAEILFRPEAAQPLWLSPALAWGEAALVVAAALGRIALPERTAGEARSG